MKNKILYKLQLLVLAGVTLFGFTTSVSAQTEATTVSGTLVDEQGNPLTGVTVYNPKGKTVISDSTGHFEIDVEDGGVYPAGHDFGVQFYIESHTTAPCGSACLKYMEISYTLPRY